ncbi:CocE/NonD family hydrolase [Bacillus sp. T33-2]|uniref:CocE/NonD family hydrolase n=1 Tax=Bacillus sp. T33-2 TaxID=2054168 RepID=UPI000C757E92|nr:CocE/NonD family hydrolase [Bacillus sp. T33-2]PLR95759.1 hydrolase [Bacillus sp. T33-2]
MPKASFKLFKSGIFLGEIDPWDTENVKSVEKMPLGELNLKELFDTDFAGEKVLLSTGEEYSLFEKIKGPAKGAEQEAEIWALMNRKHPIDLVICENSIIAFLFHGREDSMVLVKDGFEELTPLRQWKDPLLSEAKYGVSHLGTFRVKMRDGVQLATDVWLPKGLAKDTRVPAIFIRTPYGRLSKDFGGPHMLRYVHRGYAVVSQDTRGREDSDGEWIPMAHEMEDGDDSLTWIAEQDWSDGNVGMIGGSYGGFVQWAAAASGNAHLKAIVSLVTAGTPFVDLPRKGGTLLSGISAWSFMMAGQRMDPAALNRDDWEEVLNIRPIQDIPLKALGKEIPFWNEWMKHQDYDEFWEKSDFTVHGEKVNVPSLFISGWYDDDGMGTTEAWEMNQRNNRSGQRLILGPWYHDANSTRQIHNVRFGENSIRYDLDVLYLRWFDRFLKGIENGVDKEPRVEYYSVGSNKWEKDEQWPPRAAEYQNFYISSSGQAHQGTDNGTVTTEIPQEEKHDEYKFDPKDAAPYLIDVSENECSVPENYKEVEERDDVLVYTSEPFAEEFEVAGDIIGVLYASSSCRDTDWVVRVTDVDPKGNSIRLSDGIIRARYRNSFRKPEFLEPGKIEKYEIRMTKIANTFKKGHRLRISITSGAVNLAFPNQNTGNDPASDTDYIVAEQKIFHDDKYPTHVKLPIVVKD